MLLQPLKTSAILARLLAKNMSGRHNLPDVRPENREFRIAGIQHYYADPSESIGTTSIPAE